MTDTTIPPRKSPTLNHCQVVYSCFTSTETIRSIRDGEPRTTTSTFTQILSSYEYVTVARPLYSRIQPLFKRHEPLFFFSLLFLLLFWVGDRLECQRRKDNNLEGGGGMLMKNDSSIHPPPLQLCFRGYNNSLVKTDLH